MRGRRRLPRMTGRTEQRVWVLGTTAPALVFLLVVAYLPIAYAVALSFFKKTAFNPAMKWVGLDNYRFILEEPELWSAFGRSVVFTLGSVGLQLALGLVAALLLNRAFRGLNVVRSLFVLPYLLPVHRGRPGLPVAALARSTASSTRC